MTKFLSFLFLYCFCILPVLAQSGEKCGTNVVMERMRSYDATLAQKQKNLERKIQTYLETNEKSGELTLPEVITIPVVVHVLYNNDAQNISDSMIYNQMAVVNEDFSMLNEDIVKVPEYFADVVGNPKIEFCLASRDPEGNPTNGITRTWTRRSSFPQLDPNDDDYIAMHFSDRDGKDAWDTKRYLNIWVVNLAGAGTLAWAYLPGAAPEVDGIVCRYDFFGRPTINGAPYHLGRTMTHEIGHWLNLFHVFDNDGAPACSQDYVEDTPSQRAANFGCPTFPSSTCGNHSDMFMNFMDYANDDCSYMFTQGQVNRMRAAIAISRPEILNSLGCQAPAEVDVQAIGIMNPSTNSCQFPNAPVLVRIKNMGTNVLESAMIHYEIGEEASGSFAWTGELAPFTTEDVFVDVALVSPAIHQIKVYTSLPNGEADPFPESDTISKYFVTKGSLKAPFIEDFNSNPFDRAWSVYNPNNAIPWQYVTESLDQDSIYSGMMAINHGFNIFFDGLNSVDDLLMPSIDLSSVTNPQLTFDYSYYADNQHSDTLQVLISTDCYQTEQLLYTKAGDDLDTRRRAVLLYDTDWDKDTIDLKDFEGMEVSISFRSISDAGHWFFLDNVALTGDSIPVATAPLLPASDWQVYPNPTSDWVYIQHEQDHLKSLRLYDIHGRLVLDQQVNGRKSQLNLKAADLDLMEGVYFLVIGDVFGAEMAYKIVLE